MAYTSDKRLYLTSDGQVVEEGDERAATLLVGEGGQLSDEQAAQYGLTGKQAVPQAESKPQRAQATKAVNAPQGNK
jgi:hypothetical protein